jgi:hypothetical protein
MLLPVRRRKRNLVKPYETLSNWRHARVLDPDSTLRNSVDCLCAIVRPPVRDRQPSSSRPVSFPSLDAGPVNAESLSSLLRARSQQHNDAGAQVNDQPADLKAGEGRRARSKEHLLGEEAFEKQLDVMDGRQEQESGIAEGEKSRRSRRIPERRLYLRYLDDGLTTLCHG